MKEQDFENALRAELQNVPLETRKKWKDPDLHFWWLRVQAKDSYLTFESVYGSAWQYIPSMCRDLIGPDALQ
jgi:hypothetical protein